MKSATPDTAPGLRCREARARYLARHVSALVAGRLTAGPVLDATGQFKVGDWVEISASSGRIHAQCQGFPLLSWGRSN